MSRMQRFLAAPIVLAASMLVPACAGPPVPSPIMDEPVCADFAMGKASNMMEGSLRFPVRLRILEGKTVVMKMILPGLRTANATPAKSLIADDNEEITLEWAQCENERAPRLAKANTHEKEKESRDLTHYECGEAKVYKTDTLTVVKHEAASHVIHFAKPPEASCWISDLGEAPPPPPAPTVSASAPPPAPTVSPSATPAVSASAAPSAAPRK